MYLSLSQTFYSLCEHLEQASWISENSSILFGKGVLSHDDLSALVLLLCGDFACFLFLETSAYPSWLNSWYDIETFLALLQVRKRNKRGDKIFYDS